MTVLIDLLNSRKALIMLLAVVGAFLLAALGKVAGDQALEFVKWVVMTWLGAQAVVDAATRPRLQPKEQPSAPTAELTKQDQVP